MRELLTVKTMPLVAVFQILQRKASSCCYADLGHPAPSAEVRPQPTTRGTEISLPGDLKSLDGAPRPNCKKFPLTETRGKVLEFKTSW